MAHDGSQVTVEMLLREPALCGRLLGGKAGLRQEVTWCLPLSEIGPASPVGGVPHVGLHGRDGGSGRNGESGGDLAGIAVFVAAAELASAADPRAFLADLARRGAAAVFARSPAGADPELGAVMRAADSAGLPLVRLAPEADYHSVGRLVAVKAISGTAHVLEYGARVHRTLGEVFASGSGLPALARTMSTLSGATALILDREGVLLARAERDRTASDTEWQGLADAVHRRMTATADGPASRTPARTLHAHAAIGNGHGHDPVAPGHAHPSARDAVIDSPWGERVHMVSAPVRVAGDPYGTVALIEPVLPPEEHDLARHRVIVEQGAPLVASEILRQRSVTEAEERSRDDFLDTLVHGRFTDAHELQARSRHYRFDIHARHAVFVVAVPAVDGLRAQQLQRTVAAARGAAARGFTMAAFMGQLLVLVREMGPAQSGAPFDALAEKEELRSFGKRLFRAVSERTDGDVQVAYGRAAQGAPGVADGFREARIALELSRRVSVPEVCGYDELRVFAAIGEAAASEQGRAFAQEVLDLLRRADGQTGNLEQVVMAYIAESGNLNAAARRLRLHRNTMLYKLDRASRALQMDVRSSETQFMVWLAHRIETLNDSLRALRAELSPPAEEEGVRLA